MRGPPRCVSSTTGRGKPYRRRRRRARPWGSPAPRSAARCRFGERRSLRMRRARFVLCEEAGEHRRKTRARRRLLLRPFVARQEGRLVIRIARQLDLESGEGGFGFGGDRLALVLLQIVEGLLHTEAAEIFVVAAQLGCGALHIDRG